MSVTIKDVARRAKVSVATVSRVLNGSAPVQTETRDRVLAVAKALRFSPNSAARSLSTRRTLAIGAVLPDLYGEFFSELLRGMDQAARRGGYSLLVSSSHHDAAGIATAVSAMRGRVDGLAIMAPEVTRAALAKVLPNELPVVLLNGRPQDGRRGGGRDVFALTVDNYGGAVTMTRHLLALGHRRIGFIAGAAHNADAQQRERGHRTALRAAGVTIAPELVVRGDFTEASGAAGARELLALPVPPTAIFAANDAMAVGVLAHLREAGVRVPQQVAVAGFDDIPVAAFLHPPLTSMRVGIAELGVEGTQVLLNALTPSMRRSRQAAPRRQVLRAELVVRGSCGGMPDHSIASSTSRTSPNPLHGSSYVDS